LLAAGASLQIGRDRRGRTMAENRPVSAPGLAPAFSFNRHGPFYRLQRWLGLLTDTDLATGRRALLFLALAWVPAVLLAALQGFALNEHHERAILYDFSAYAFAIAVIGFVLMEQTSDRRMAWLVSQFAAHGIAPETSRGCFATAREGMARRTGSWLAETVILVGAYCLAYVWIRSGAARVDGGTWFAQLVDDHLQLNLAGWWLLLVALPLFWFLLGRWLWRFVTWGLLLRDVARCELRLVATHPDRCGGLAFIGQYPQTYVLFVFSLSLVIAATVLKKVVFAGASLMSFKFALLGLIVFLVVAFVLPLLAFTPVLVRLKRQGLSRYGALVSRHHLEFEAKWIGGGGTAGAPDADPLGSPDMSSLADLSASYQIIQELRPVPVTRQSIFPLVVAALLPFVVVAATQMPVKQILGTIKGLLLL
jgi:hypothetical protein